MPKSVLLLQMIDVLRERPGLTIGQLAADLGRSERTVYRYLESLSSELHVQIYCENGGYHIAERSVPSHLDLSPKEVLAVRLALTSGAFQKYGPLTDQALAAWRKIESALMSDTIETVHETIKRHAIFTSAFAGSDEKDETIDILANAVTQNRRVSIVYSSQRSGETKKLEVDPYALVFRRHNWYLIAYSHSHGRIIQLKLVRIIRITETGDRFQLPHDFSIDSFYAKSWEMWTGGEEYLVKVKFSPRVAQIIKESKRHPTQVLEDTPDGGVIFSARVTGIEEIGFWILGWGAEAEVLEPDELRSSIIEIASNLLALYSEEAIAKMDVEETDEDLPEVKIEKISEIRPH